MPEIAVSVLCLVYNHSKYLRKALDGFVQQETSFPFEVIVHDDASTDNSAEIIREYEQKYPDIIRPIYQKENQHSQRINFFHKYLYPSVRGKYFAICEGDDYWSDPTKLQQQYDALEAHPDCSMSAHIVRSISEDGTPLNSTIPEILKLEAGVQNADELIKKMFTNEFYVFQTASYFFRSELLDYIRTKAKDFIDHCPALDYGWVLSALCIGNCFFIDKEMSCYRRNSVGSWSNQQKKKNTHNRFNSRVSISLSFYDDLTEQKYHKLLLHSIAEHEYNTLTYRQQYANRKESRFAPLYAKNTQKQRFLLGCCYYFPPFSPLYAKLKHLRSKQILSK